MFGVCVWASHVTGFPLSEVYHVFKFMRRRSRSGLGDSQTTVWNSIKPVWSRWISALATGCFTWHLEQDLPALTLFTDASQGGWGAVCFTREGRTLIFGDRFSKAERRLHINVKEALAVKKVLPLLVSAFPRGADIKLFIDNTTAMSWINKRYSSRFVPNAIVTDIMLAASALDFNIQEAEYVPSALNFADAPSRQKP